MHLNNFFFDCSCGHTIKFRDTEEMHPCPECKKTVVLSNAYKELLVSRREKSKAQMHAQQLA